MLPVAKVKGTVKGRNREVAAIKGKVEQIIKDKKKANTVLEIIATMESDDVAVVNASILGLSSIFVHYLKQQEMCLPKHPNPNVNTFDDERKYKMWLLGIYGDVTARLAEICVEGKPKTQELAFSTLMKFLTLEGKKPLDKAASKKADIPMSLLQKIVSAMLSKTMDTKNVVSRFEEYLEYVDVKYHTLMILNDILKTIKSHESDEVYIYNCFNVIKSISLSPADAESQEFLFKSEDENSAQFQFNLVAARKMYGSAWFNFLKAKLPVTLHRRVLAVLDEKVMVNMDAPLLLTDFLMDSYNLGGVYRILALNGIFVLMHKHNLEFPDFYTKLYSLLDESVFHTKYSPRFFFLCHIFLTSSHLPEYMVAAFVKRFARLSLTAPPNSSLLIIAFVTNLLIRHRSLRKMINNPDGPKDISEDPYIMNEPDMSKCNANESSLWEMKMLQQHYNPRVSMSARFVDKKLPKTEVDVTHFLEMTTSDMITGETKKKRKEEVPLTFAKPVGLFGNDDVAMKELWSF